MKSDAGEPLPFVSISIKGTNIGTSSDISGMFRIALRRRDSILVFPLVIGYETKQVFIKNSQNLEVNLVKISS